MRPALLSILISLSPLCASAQDVRSDADMLDESIRPGPASGANSTTTTGRGQPDPRDPFDYNLPSTCLEHLPINEAGNRGLFYLPAACLEREDVSLEALPQACLMQIDSINDGAPFYSAPCLLDRDFVLGY